MSYQSKSVVRVHREPMWRDRIHVDLFFVKVVDGIQSVAHASAGELKPVDENESVSFAPTFSLHTEEAQQLMDELWSCGLRPTEGTGSAGAMAATQAHLKDLQRLVFKDKAPS